MSAPAIRTDGLTKYYGHVIGVEALSLEVAEGDVFGFLGANGSGKTTTIRLLLDLLRPSAGTASVAGFDCQRQGLEARRRIGYLPGEMPIYPELTGAGYLKFLAALGDRPVKPARLAALLRRFDVSDVDLRRRMRDYSHGMKQKLGLVQAMMSDAPLLILDEPTTGLDPLMIRAFCECIDEIVQAGRTTVFLSSHVLSEVDRLCSRVGLIRAGRLVTVHALAELRLAAPRRLTVRFSAAVDGDVPDAPGVTVVSRDAYYWVIETHAPLGGVLATLRTLPVADIEIDAFRLDDVVVKLMAEERPC